MSTQNPFAALVTQVPPTPPPPPPPLTFVVNPQTDFQVLYSPSFFGQPGYQIPPWNAASVEGATRLQAYLTAKLGLKPTIGYGYPYSPPAVLTQQAFPGMVPFFQFPVNSDGTVPGPVGNSPILIVGGALWEYLIAGDTGADANMLGFFKTTN
jgi:hypothetical protein